LVQNASRTVGLDGERGAGLDGHAIHRHHARAALAGVAADLGARQAGITQEMDEENPGLDVLRIRAPVDGDRDGMLHGTPPPEGG
jgi:hypothetical protein